MNDFLHEMRKRKNESDRIANIQRRARVVNQKLLDELEALCVMTSMTSENELSITNNKFYTIIRQLELTRVVGGFMYNGHLISSYSNYYKPIKKISVKKIKGNKSIIEFNYELALETINEIQKLKNVQMRRTQYSDFDFNLDREIDNEITISNLEQLIENGVFSKLFIMLVEPLTKKSEKVV